MFTAVPAPSTFSLCALAAGALRRLLRRFVVALHAGGGADLTAGWLPGGVALVRVVSPNSAKVAACPVVVSSRMLTCTLISAIPHLFHFKVNRAVCKDFKRFDLT